MGIVGLYLRNINYELPKWRCKWGYNGLYYVIRIFTSLERIWKNENWHLTRKWWQFELVLVSMMIKCSGILGYSTFRVFFTNWAASKTSMKGFSIQVHVGTPPAKAKPPRAKAARKLRERGASRQSGESSGESSQIVEMHWNIHVQDHLRVIFRESNCERYYETNVAAKATTARAKEPRKPSRKLMRTRTKSLPGFRRCSTDSCFVSRDVSHCRIDNCGCRWPVAVLVKKQVHVGHTSFSFVAHQKLHVCGWCQPGLSKYTRTHTSMHR